MGFLNKLLNYNNICIQCHNNPDADGIASAFAVHRYLKAHGINAHIVYGGELEIKKNATKMMVRECGIPIIHTHHIEGHDLLLLVDCQYGLTNVEKFSAENIMVIDHHVQVLEQKENYLINSSYQSCSTIIYELLEEEGYHVKEDETLSVALLYGLYTDTSCFSDLFGEADVKMRAALLADYPLFERLIKSNMSLAELMVASDAMNHHYFDPGYRFAIVSAIKCDQTVLGIIGDLVIQVDAIYLSFAYTDIGTSYQISLRSCYDKYPANKIAEYVCDGIGGGGGHAKKAGGLIVKKKMREKYGTDDIFNVVNRLLCKYMEKMIHVYVMSAFSKDTQGGNKAGVVLNREDLTVCQKMEIAKELGYSETVFVTKSDRADYKIEYYTPTDEVPLCGHATIAAFSLLYHLNMLKKEIYSIETKAGLLRIKIGEDGLIFMEQNKPEYLDIQEPDQFSDCLETQFVSKEYPIQTVTTGLKDIIMPIDSTEHLAELSPNFEVMTELSREMQVVGVHAFALTEGMETTAICRNFAPLYGIDEESATGTANCALASYLYRHYQKKEQYIFEQGHNLGQISRIIVDVKAENDEIQEIFVGGYGYLACEKEIAVDKECF